MTNLLTKKTLTFEEYLLLPYDGKRSEFVDGRIIEMTEPSGLHIAIVDKLADILKQHFADEDLDLVRHSGPGVEIPRVGKPNNSRDPDMLVCTREQWQDILPLTKALFLRDNPPLLVIEVVSPSTVKTDTQDKRADYAVARVPEYWVVNPVEGYVSIWVLDGRMYRPVGEYRGEELLESQLLSKLRVSAGEILKP